MAGNDAFVPVPNRQGSHSGSASPLALRAAEASSLPALISPLQTAAATRSAAPKASSALYRPQDPKPSKYLSAAHPSVRGSGARGRRSLPSFNSLITKTTCTSYALQTSSFMDDFIYKQDSRCSSPHFSCFGASGGVPRYPSGMGAEWPCG